MNQYAIALYKGCFQDWVPLKMSGTEQLQPIVSARTLGLKYCEATVTSLFQMVIGPDFLHG